MLPTPLRLVRTVIIAHVVLLVVVAALGLLVAALGAAFTAGRTGPPDPRDWSAAFVPFGLIAAAAAGGLALFLGATVRLVRGSGGAAAVTALVMVVLLEASFTIWAVPTAIGYGGTDVAAAVGLLGLSSLAVVVLTLLPGSVAWVRRSWRATPARQL